MFGMQSPEACKEQAPYEKEISKRADNKIA